MELRAEAEMTEEHFLQPLMPRGIAPEAFLPSDALDALDAHRRALEGLGFAIEAGPHSLQIRHGDSGFDFVTHFSDQDDLGERRRLFAALIEQFGGFWDRVGWLVRPGRSVTVPYDHLKAVLGTCQSARIRLRRIK